MSYKRNNMEIIGFISDAQRSRRHGHRHLECIQQPLIYETERCDNTGCTTCPYFMQGMKVETTFADITCFSKVMLSSRFGVA